VQGQNTSSHFGPDREIHDGLGQQLAFVRFVEHDGVPMGAQRGIGQAPDSLDTFR